MEDDTARKEARVKFDPNRIEDHLVDMDTLFALETGTHKHTNKSKMAMVGTSTDNPELIETARGWMGNGIPDSIGDMIIWGNATWSDARSALCRTYPARHISIQAADDLSALTKTSRAPRHAERLITLLKKLDQPVDLESRSRLDTNRVMEIVPKDMHRACKRFEDESPHQQLTDESREGQLTKVKHFIKQYLELNVSYDARATEAVRKGKKVNANCWEVPKPPRREKRSRCHLCRKL